MKIKLTKSQMCEVVDRVVNRNSQEGFRLFRIINEWREETDADMEAELGFSEVTTIEQCLSLLEKIGEVMDTFTRQMVIEWFARNHNAHMVLKELGDDPVEEATKIFDITYNQALICERASFRKVSGIVAARP